MEETLTVPQDLAERLITSARQRQKAGAEMAVVKSEAEEAFVTLLRTLQERRAELGVDLPLRLELESYFSTFYFLELTRSGAWELIEDHRPAREEYRSMKRCTIMYPSGKFRFEKTAGFNYGKMTFRRLDLFIPSVVRALGRVIDQNQNVARGCEAATATLQTNLTRMEEIKANV